MCPYILKYTYNYIRFMYDYIYNCIIIYEKYFYGFKHTDSLCNTILNNCI